MVNLNQIEEITPQELESYAKDFTESIKHIINPTEKMKQDAVLLYMYQDKYGNFSLDEPSREDFNKLEMKKVSLSYDQILEELKKDCSIYQNIMNATEEIIHFAQENGYEVLADNEPTEKMLELEIKEFPERILLMKESSDKLKLIAIKSFPVLIDYIYDDKDDKDIPEEIRKASVYLSYESGGESYFYGYDDILKILEEYPYTIDDIQNKTNELIEFSEIRKNPYYIKKIKNPTNLHKKAAAMKISEINTCNKKTSYDDLLEELKKDKSLIHDIIFPTEEMYLIYKSI